MKPYPLAVRHGVVQAMIDGRCPEEVCHDFGVSRTTIARYLQQWQERGDLTPKPIPGAPRHILPEQHDALRAQLQAHAGARLVDHCRWWEASHGRYVSVATMSRAVARLGWRR